MNLALSSTYLPFGIETAPALTASIQNVESAILPDYLHNKSVNSILKLQTARTF